MVIMLIRSLILFILTFVVVRLMGKRQIGEMQPFEFVITLIIADLACVPMAELAVPLTHGIVPILALYLLHFFICFLSRKSIKFRYIVTGKPAIVIKPTGIDYNELRKLNMTIDDLMELIRGCDCFEIDQIAYAIIETNGNLCVMPKADNMPVTRGDLKISAQKNALPMHLIIDGKLMKQNLSIAEVDDKLLEKYYKKVNVASYKQILLFTIDNNGKIFIQPKNKDKYFVFIEDDFKGGKNW